MPLPTRYDGYERLFGPPIPHLSQRHSQHRLQVISPDRIRELLTEHALRVGIVDVDGTLLRFTPHDFRRIFSTETVNGGLPIHITAKLLGHLDLSLTFNVLPELAQYELSSRSTRNRSSRARRRDMPCITASRNSRASKGLPQHSHTPQPPSSYSLQRLRYGSCTNPRQILMDSAVTPGHR
ncbi:tyrosine-type recombinase/integrase [Streptomyces rishiriensis]|uniref:tyrosine-type recombinase/integrase n=1 Tax=Streptomyces rishiriensis TaxID=68264 RepID=UPI0033C9ECFD